MKITMFKTAIVLLIICLASSLMALGIAISNKNLNMGFGRMNILLPRKIHVITGNNVLKTETRKFEEFDSITVSNVFVVNIDCGKEQNFEISGDENILAHVTSTLKGKTLKIGFDTNSSYDKTPRIKISLMKLKKLKASGANYVDISSLKNDNFKLDLLGISNIKLNGSTNYLDVKSMGATKLSAKKLKVKNAKIYMSGTSKAELSVSESLYADLSGATGLSATGEISNLNAKLSGAANLRGNNLEAKVCVINLSGCSKANLKVVDSLNAKLSGISRLIYHGNPSKLKKKKSGMSQIIKN